MEALAFAAWRKLSPTEEMTMRRVLFATAVAAIALVGLSANSCGEKKEEATPPAAAPAAPPETPPATTPPAQTPPPPAQ
jgi:hypothetical protein